MSEVAGFSRIGHIDDGRSVVFLLARKWVEDVVAVVADVGDPAVALLVDDGLVGAASLEIVVADKLHVALLGLVLGQGRREQDSEYRNSNGTLRAKARHAFLLG